MDIAEENDRNETSEKNSYTLKQLPPITNGGNPSASISITSMVKGQGCC